MSDQKQDPRDRAHQMPQEELLDLLRTNTKTGLQQEQISEIQKKYGLNELKKPEGESIWEKIKEQFEDILVRILLASAVISFIISMLNNDGGAHEIPAWVEPLVIFIILVANACVGIYQDYDAEKALQALQSLQTLECKVLRDGRWQQVDSKQVVPGDIVHVYSGEQLPADIRVLSLKTPCLKVDQSNLTGETDPVNKEETANNIELSTILSSSNMLFSSNLIATGNAVGVVVKTGMDTQIGIVQSLVMDAQDEEQESPLKKRLDEFGDQLAKCIFVICIMIWVINYRNFFDPVFGSWVKGALYYFKIAVALAVAAIPEGLPAVITTCLALGTRRMAKHRSIVRRLMSVETLGCTTVICTDKTGTLTTNNMTAVQMITFNQDQSVKGHKVEGVSYDLVGEVTGLEDSTDNIQWLLKSLVNNNDSQLVDREGIKGIIGLPTEGALKVLAAKIQRQLTGKFQVEEQGLESIKQERIATLEFNRKRKAMSVLCQDQQGQRCLYIKQATELLIENCVQLMDNQGQVQQIKNKDALYAQIEKMADQGLRTIAIGVVLPSELGSIKDYDPISKTPTLVHQQLVNEEYSALEQGVTLLGFVGIRDPCRPEVPQAIQKCQRAGINVIMITGDNYYTAKRVAEETGIIQSGQVDHIYEGDQAETLDITTFKEAIKNKEGMVFSRTTPYHKRLLVQLLQSENQVVAMTGDGTNDAPALKTADIGIAMGISGTDVAKQASDMILADDNFATIVEAVEEGRAIYANMKAFIRYMISSNIGEVFSIFITAVAGLPEGMNSLQLLWVNLVTDGLPATALSFNPPDAHVMKKPPRKHDEGIISGWIFVRYMIIGLYVGIATVGIFVYWYTSYNWSTSGHQLISYHQLSNWSECQNWTDFQVSSFGIYDFSQNPCDYFKWGKQTASTLSLSVLVMIEMLNALNALSEDSSILSMGLFCNPWLLLAILGSMLFHCLILYIPLFSQVFGTVPLTQNDWILVFAFSFPVIILDEILKAISRYSNRKIYNTEIYDTEDKIKVE